MSASPRSHLNPSSRSLEWLVGPNALPSSTALSIGRLGRPATPRTTASTSSSPCVPAAMDGSEGAGTIVARRGRITVRDREAPTDMAGGSDGSAEAEHARLSSEADA